MSNAHVWRMPHLGFWLIVIASASLAVRAHAETGEWRTPKKATPKHDASMVRTDADSTEPEPERPAPQRPAPERAAAPTAARTPPHGLLARLIENPDQTAGAPPYALTDQAGTVQRYIEPVPGIELTAYVDQVVRVRNDTGLTLLASQLELPPRPLRPSPLAAAGGIYPDNPRRGTMGITPLRSASPYGIERVQYVDNDDTTVELLPEEMPLPDGAAAGTSQRLEMLGDGYPGCPGYPGAMMPGEMCGPQGCGPQFCDPALCGPGMMPPFAGPMAGGCPQCGRYHDGWYGGDGGCPPPGPTDERPHLYGDVDLLFFRPRFTDDVVGKLSETYELSPRFILGVRNLGDLGVRARYWLYARDTNTLAGGDIRLELDVFDLEATHRIAGRRSQVDLAAGIRWANFLLADVENDQSSTDMVGLTMAADGLTKCLVFSRGHLGFVYGGRVSLLGGDWGGDDDSAFIDNHAGDDNMLVTELYAGGEIAQKLGPATIHARAIFEIQNWRSDALAQEAGIESISLLGPGLQIGAEF